jgi:hypothetical protein
MSDPEQPERRPLANHELPDPCGGRDPLLAPIGMASAHRPEPPRRVRNGTRGYRRFLLETELNR